MSIRQKIECGLYIVAVALVSVIGTIVVFHTPLSDWPMIVALWFGCILSMVALLPQTVKEIKEKGK